jgi:hypothetical protein
MSPEIRGMHLAAIAQQNHPARTVHTLCRFPHDTISDIAYSSINPISHSNSSVLLAALYKLLARGMPCALRVSIFSFVHSWQRRMGLDLSISWDPLNCFAGGGLARQIDSSRARSSTLICPNGDFDTKEVDKEGFLGISLALKSIPFWTSALTWKRDPSPSTLVATQTA